MRTIWDFWANKYERLWVQKYSLTPTRNEILKIIKGIKTDSILDMGCGTGQLTREIQNFNKEIKIIGVDYSEEMIKVAKEKSLDSSITYINANIENFKLEKRVDLITCTHSFPYYSNKIDAIKSFNSFLNDEGILLLAQASENSFYDKICMLGVKATTTKAKYLSIKELKELSKDYFNVEDVIKIKEKWYMPTIIVMKMKKINKGEKSNG